MTKRDSNFLLRSVLSNTAIMAVLLLALFAFKSLASEVSVIEIEKVRETPISFNKNINIEIPAQSFAIFDVESGEIIFSKNPNTQLPIASITKLVTALAIDKNWPLDKDLVITNSDVAEEGRAGKLEVGQSYSYHELLFPLLLESSNDVAAAFIRDTNGMVIENMNNLTKEIGLSDTKFSDASGLSAGNISTASDLVLLILYMYSNSSNILDITKLSKYVGSYTGWINNNPVYDKTYQGGKHGYTEAAGRTVVSLFEEEFGNEKKVIGYVILDSNNLKSDMSTLRESIRQAVVFE
ncbi:MAG: serine hydrolase [Candidatus Paceibacterota bacterium]